MLRTWFAATVFIGVLILAAAPAQGVVAWEGRIISSTDDSEDRLDRDNDYCDLGSSDLEFPHEDSDGGDRQMLGLRFQNIGIPQGAAITSAYIEFVVDETGDGDLPVSVLIEGELSPDASTFADAAESTAEARVKTFSSAVWAPAAWTAENQVDQTSDISAIIEEIVNQSGWAAGNALVITIRDDPDNPSEGRRIAESYDGEKDSAPLLHIEWTTNDKATVPNPDSGATNVWRDADLSWKGNSSGDTYVLYFGLTAKEVAAASESDAAGVSVDYLDTASFDPGRFAYETTYYWRVDIVSAAGTTTKGYVWSFTVESETDLLSDDDMAVEASSQADEDQGPENTINGSGLEDGLHSANETTMWSTELLDGQDFADTYIEYEFGEPVALQKMVVWNYNGNMEAMLGRGIKDVKVEYSLDGMQWNAIDAISLFKQGTGQDGLEATDTFELSPPVAASFVRITPLSNWGNMVPQCGLSEVQFYTVPASAANLEPEDGATIDIADATTMTWQPGRYADQHVLMLGADPNALVEVATVTEAQYDIAALVPVMGQTYYWRIDEVNVSESSTWVGQSQSFSILPYSVVDDFESYGNFVPNRPFQTWIDGLGFSPDDFYPSGKDGNGSGGLVGHDIWDSGNSHYNGSIMDTDVSHDDTGIQSLPFYYNGMSEMIRTFAEAQDWSQNGFASLSLWFFGDTSNTPAALYVAVNGNRVNYDGSADDLTQVGWHAWNIPLSAFGASLDNVIEMTVGVEGDDAAGILFFDDFRLSAEIAQLVAPVEPDATALLGHWTLDGNVSDSSGLDNHGTTAIDAVFVDGPNGGQALDFDGDQHVAFDSIDSYVATDADVSFTVSVWVKTTADEEGTVFAVNTAETEHPILMGVTGDGVPFVEQNDDDRVNHIVVECTPVINDNAWHLMTFAKDGSEGALYVDGLLRRSFTCKFTLEEATRWSLGQEWDDDDASNQFVGQMADARIYSYALAAEEAASLFGLTSTMYTGF
jgi:hypothetical protein